MVLVSFPDALHYTVITGIKQTGYMFINLSYQLWCWYIISNWPCVRAHKSIFLLLLFVMRRVMCILHAPRRYPLTGAVLYWYETRVKLVTRNDGRDGEKYQFIIVIINFFFLILIYLCLYIDLRFSTLYREKADLYYRIFTPCWVDDKTNHLPQHDTSG